MILDQMCWHTDPLNEFETIIFEFVKKHPGVKANDIEDSLGVSSLGVRQNARVFDALILLISKGLITFTLDRPIRYFPR